MEDPMEKHVRDTLQMKGIKFTEEQAPENQRLDFFVPSLGLHIEVKQFHSPRISNQMARVPNIIAIQGLGAAKAFRKLLLA